MKKQTLKSLIVPAVMVMIGFGLMAGCKKKGNNQGMTADTTQTSMNNQGAMQGREQGNMQGQMVTYTAQLKGQNEVPSNNSDATGTVKVTVHGDSIHVSGQFSGLSSDYKASHIHMGAKGENGNVIQPLDPDINSDQKSGSFDESHTLNNSQMQALENGKMYVNVHSQQHPKGEIRGQLTSSNSGMNNNMNQSGSDTMGQQ